MMASHGVEVIGTDTGDTVLRCGVRKTSKYVDRYEDFIKNLQQHVEFISLMQIPHHGSWHTLQIDYHREKKLKMQVVKVPRKK